MSQNLTPTFNLAKFIFLLILVSPALILGQDLYNKKMVLFLEETLNSSELEVYIPGLSQISAQDITPAVEIPKKVEPKSTSFDLRWIMGIGVSPTLEISLPSSGKVQLFIYDLEGTKVGELFNGYIEEGVFQIQSDLKNFGSKIKSGMALFVINYNGNTVTQKLLPLYP
jgi:hypothetical protein